MQLLSNDFLESIKQAIIDSLVDLIKTTERKIATDCRYLKKQEACKYIGITRPTLEKWIAGGLPVISVGGVERIDKNDIDLFLLKNKK